MKRLEDMCDLTMAPDEGLHPGSRKVMESMLAKLAEQNNGVVPSVGVFRNHSVEAGTGHPTGYMMLMQPQTLVVPEMVHDGMFETLVLCPVDDPDEQLTEADIVQKRKLLDLAAPVLDGTSASLAHRDEQTYLDSQPWGPALGTQDAFVGVYEKRDDPTSRWGKGHYVVARAGVPKAAQALRKLVADRAESGAPMTVEELTQSPEYAWARNAGIRNAKRLAWNAARKLQLPIACQEDHSAYQDETVRRPLMAYPAHTQLLSEIAPVEFNNKEYYALLNNVARLQNNTDELFVVQGPREGILQFDTSTSTPDIGAPCTTRQLPVSQARERSGDAKMQAKHYIYPNQHQQPVHSGILKGAWATADARFRDDLDLLKIEDVISTVFYHPVLCKVASRAPAARGGK